MIYLAIPYTDADPAVMDARAAIADRVAASLVEKGYEVYSPISSWHHIAQKYGLPTYHGYWQTMNEHIMFWCEHIIVITAPGWETSRGVQEEIAYAEQLSMEIEFTEVPEDI